MQVKKSFATITEVSSFNEIDALLVYLNLKPDDLLVTEKRVYNAYLEAYIGQKSFNIIFKEDFISSANSYEQFIKLQEHINFSYKRVIGIGGGGTLDLAKLLSVDCKELKSLFFDHAKVKKIADLFLVPTTPGTGSEVTPFAALYFENRGLQFVLSDFNLFAQEALLCPKFLENIPFDVLLASAFDAFVHAIESYLSPLATYHSSIFSTTAIKDLLECFLEISSRGFGAIEQNYSKIQLAGNLAGIAYANAGCAAVHALAYPLCSRLKIHHGEANYLVFFDVMDLYLRKKPEGKISSLIAIIAQALLCNKDDAMSELIKLCDTFMIRKRLSEFGMKESQILEFTDMVLSRQHLLIANGYEVLSSSEISDIYQNIL